MNTKIVQHRQRSSLWIKNVDQWSSWSNVGQVDSFLQDNLGNGLGYTVEFKQKPYEEGDDTAVFGTKTQSRMDPARNRDGNYFSYVTKHRHEWESASPVNAQMTDTGPNGDIGSETETMQVGFSSGGTVEAGISNSTTSPELEIDNESSPDINNYHKIKGKYYNGEIGSEFTKVDSLSTADINHEFSRNPKPAVEIDIYGKYQRPNLWWSDFSDLQKTFKYNIFGPA